MPKSLTTVTTLSKIIAGTLFVALPFVGFVLGVQYGQSLGRFQAVEQTIEQQTLPMPTTVQQESMTSKNVPANWKEFKDEVSGFSMHYPDSWTVEKLDTQKLGTFAFMLNPEGNKKVSLTIAPGGFFAFGYQPDETKNLSTNILGKDITMEESIASNHSSAGPLIIAGYGFIKSNTEYQIFYSTGSPITEGSSVADYEANKAEALQIISTISFEK